MLTSWQHGRTEQEGQCARYALGIAQVGHCFPEAIQHGSTSPEGLREQKLCILVVGKYRSYITILSIVGTQWLR